MVKLSAAVQVATLLTTSVASATYLSDEQAIRTNLRLKIPKYAQDLKSEPCAGLSIAEDIADLGLDPQKDLLLGSTRATWTEFCDVVTAWNAKYTDRQFLNENNKDDNLYTLAAFLGNAAHESAKFVACGEYIQPCHQDVCSSGSASDYEDSKWGSATDHTCWQMPVPTETSWTLTGKGGAVDGNACNFPAESTCTDWDGRTYKGADCWFGRGALQLTWNCNYAKMQAVIGGVPNLQVDLCADPDSVCKDGKAFWAGSVAYWMTVVEDQYKKDHSINTAMNCVKSGCSAPHPEPWHGSGWQDRVNEYNYYLKTLDAPSQTPTVQPTTPPTAPTIPKVCSDWNTVCGNQKCSAQGCVQCTSDPVKWQCNDP